MSDSIERWLSYLTIEKGLLPNTRRLYLRVLDDVRRDVGDPENLSTDDLRRWLHRRGGSASSISNRISALRSFYRYLVKAGARIDDPTLPLEPPAKPPRERDPVEDLSEALQRLDEEDVKANGKGGLPRRLGETRDMAVFLAETGMRISEAVACDWPVPCPSEVTVIGRGHKELVISVSDRAREAWDRLGGHWPVGTRASQRRFERADFHPHQLRHWHAINIAGSHQPPQQQQAPSSSLQSADNGLREISANLSDQEVEVVISYLTDLLEVRRKPPRA